MTTWPFWLLFLGSGVLALVVVKRFDDLEQRALRERQTRADTVPPPSADQKQT